MANIELSFCLTSNARTRPIIDGAVKIDGVEPTFTVLTPGEVFWRQLHFNEFDVSEMSLSSLLMVLASGDERWWALPIFTTRSFFHTEGIVREGAGINRPEDLPGKRMGVAEYQQTAALWSRGVLQHELGVDPRDLFWFMERTPERSHGGAVGFTPPPGIRLEYIPEDRTIATMLVAGELDAAMRNVARRSFVNRGDEDLRTKAGLRPLFPDPEAEGVRYFQKTGILPINHCMIVRRSLIEKHPWLALNLYLAFSEANERSQAAAKRAVEPYFLLGYLPASHKRAMDENPFPYGVQANRKTLEALAEYSHEQGLTPRRLGLDEIFAHSTLEV